MSSLTENQKTLALFLKDSGFSAEDTVAICLCCRDDNQAKSMLNYCKTSNDLELSNLLEKAVEISNSKDMNNILFNGKPKKSQN